MKTTSFRFFLAALATTAALVGCTKEITPNFENDKVNPAAEGSRVITVSFAPQTKTTLDGFQPRFEDGKDTVLISNTNALDTCVVSVKDNKATISTDLTGPLTAVYPYKAAKMSEGNENEIDTVLVSTEQSGKFADANICMARMTDENEESLSFENKTTVFCIKPPTNSPEYVEVSAEGFDIANCYQTGSAYTSFETIHVNTTTADSVYVSILVPENLTVGSLSFSDGTNVKTIKDERASTAIAAGTLYTVTNANWESTEADIPDGALKGVFSVSADKQVYFSQGNLYAKKDNNGMWNWGFYAKQYQYNSLSTSNPRTAQNTDTEIDLFTWGYSESTSLLPAGNTYVTAHTTTEDKQLVYNTDSGDDWGVAYCNSNNIAVGTWRTLTTAEWQYLVNTRAFNNGTNTGEGYSYQRAKINSDATGVYGMILYPDNYTGTAQTSYTSAEWVSLENAGCVFLPAAGYRYSSDVDSVGVSGSYWSSTARGEYFAYDVYFPSGDVYPDNYAGRNLGFSVRLVTDVSAAPTPTPTEPDYVEITAKYDGEDQPARALKWATKNLAITDSGKKSWKGGNESAVKVPGTNEDVIVGDYFQWAASYSGYGITEDSHKVIDSLLIYTAFTNSGCGDSENNLTYKSAGAGKTYQFDTESDDSHIGISPYYSGSAYSKYTSSSQPTLQRTPDNDDVASIILGGTWRMHTSAEFQALCNVTYWAWDDTDKGYYVYTPNPESDAGKVNEGGSGEYNKSAALLFFPDAGGVDYTGLGFVGSYGYYWSNSLGTDTDRAYNLEFEDSSVEPQSNIVRYAGFSVRPVSD